MKRRSFLASTSAVFGATSLLSQAEGAEARPAGGELYELRTYTLKAGKKPVLDDYLSKAFMPALGRLGTGPVGVFSESAPTEPLSVYVLIVYKSADQLFSLSQRLDADAEYRSAAGEYLAAGPKDAVYDRIESSILLPIEGMQSLAKPDTSNGRLLNLRTYESHNERAAKKKIEMFNTAEMPIFRKVGLTPVFFGQTIAGPRLPNLTYMLVFPDEAGRKAAWDRFKVDEDWNKLKAVPEFADKEIVSKITNKILTPESYSQI